MATLKQIKEFLDSEPIAMVGVSRNPKKFGYAAFKELKGKRDEYYSCKSTC